MQVEVITHRFSGAKIFGRRLVAGEILRRGDRCDSSDGSWKECQTPGRPVSAGSHFIWVRPLRVVVD